MIRKFLATLRSLLDSSKRGTSITSLTPFDSDTMPRYDCNKFDYYRIYEAVWRNMERENALIGYRAGWCIFLTAGIFAAEAIATNILLQAREWTVPLLFAMAALSVAASMVCAGSARGVNAALYQIDYLRAHYGRFLDSKKRNIFEDDLLLPRPFGDDPRHYDGHLNARLFPATLALIWLGIAVAQIGAATALMLGWTEFRPPSLLNGDGERDRATLTISVHPTANGPMLPAPPIPPVPERQIANGTTPRP